LKINVRIQKGIDMDDVLYIKHRPKDFSEVVGQDDAVATLMSLAKQKKFPHALAFFGESGCGKTTLARIVARKLKCGGPDLNEINAAESRGIEMVRSIQKRMSLKPISGKCRVWIIDECHQLTSDAQSALLKILEDSPRHVYFMLCTTDPQKLKKTIHTRCTKIIIKPVQTADMIKLIKKVAREENATVSDEVIDKIVEVAEGSCRQALVSLNAVIGMDEDDMLQAIVNSNIQDDAFELAKLLMNPKANWTAVAEKLKEFKTREIDPEGIRRMVLGFAGGCLRGKGNHPRSYNIIIAFADNFFDSGHAGLAAACYEVVKQP